ncbi:MAG: T9SS C-terminal target domain-containing protein [Cytophagales bacterium]|nr:MAG: T9SS C-terminal target domain-containing protein [Cytophagales bacterium]
MKYLNFYLLLRYCLFFMSIFAYSVGYAQVEQTTQQRIKDDPEGRIEYERRMLINPFTGEIPDDIRNKELNYVLSPESKLQPSFNARNSQPNWTRRGPFNVGGRTRGLAIDRTNENVILAGGVSGGMWRSDDGGNSWTKTTTSSQFHNVTCLIQDPRPGFSNVWYFGTGEGSGNSASGGSAGYRGNGIYKSTDGGNTWSLLASTNSDPTVLGGGSTFGGVGAAATGGDFQYIWNIAINPTNGHILAATYTGIMRSTDGGLSWTKVLAAVAGTPTTIRRTDVLVNANGLAMATLESAASPNAGFWYSDNGVNWVDITPSALNAFAAAPSAYTRVVIANVSSAPNTFFFFLAMTGGTGNTNGFGLLKYSHSTSIWENLSPNLPTYGGSVGNMGQAIYNQYVKVKPDDLNYLFLGTTNLNRTTNGFATAVNATTDPNRFNWIGGYATANNVSTYSNHHPDNHALVFFPSNPKKAISAHDGGLSVTEDITASPVVWKALNNGYFTTQAYGLAIDENTAGDMRMMAGFQDNGKWTTYGTSSNDIWYEEFGGGDGCYVAIVPNAATNGHRRYTSTQNGSILRFDGIDVRNFTDADGIQPSTATGASGQLFVNPYILDPADFNKMYYPAGRYVYYNSNLNGINSGYTFNGTATNWTQLSNSDVGTGNTITTIAASKSPTAGIVYYGTNAGKLFRLDNAPSNPTAVNIYSASFPTGAYVSSIAVDENNGQNVIVVFSNYGVKSVWFSNDGGTNWTDVSGNLEQNADGTGNGPSVRWAEIINYTASKGYFVGTSTGLYYTETLNGTSTQWLQQSPDLIGNTVVMMIKTRDTDGLVAVASHANGLYSAFYGNSDLPPVAVNEIADVSAYKNDAPTVVNLAGFFRDPDNTNATITLSVQANTNGTLVTPSISGNVLTLTYANNQTGVAFITIRATSNGKTVDEIFKVTVNEILAANVLYDQINTLSISSSGFRMGRYTDNSYATIENFEVPTGQNWAITAFQAYCFTLGSGAASLTNLDLFIYNDNAGAVGTLRDSIRITSGNVAGLPALGASGTVTVTLPSTLNLTAGKYWVRISPNFNNATTVYRLVWYTSTTVGVASSTTPADKRPFDAITSDFAVLVQGTATGTSAAATPSELTANAISLTQIRLNWKDNGDKEAGFVIQRSTSSGTGFATVAQVPANTTTWTDNTGIAFNTTYYYRVAGFDVVGNSAYSNEANARLTAVPTSPTTLTLLAATNATSNALQWTDAATNESGYEVMRSFVQGRNYSLAGSVGANQNTFTDQNNLESAQDYFYVVRATASQGKSSFSNEVVDLATPTNLKATAINGSNGITLTWEDKSNAEANYKIERSTTTGAGFTEIGTVAANALTYTDNTAVLGNKYFYRVRGTATNGFSSYSTEANETSGALQVTALSNSLDNSLVVYPNPTQDYFIVKLENFATQEVKVEVLSLQGQLLDRQILALQANQLQATIHVKSYLKGIYIVRISDGNTVTERKIVVQ